MCNLVWFSDTDHEEKLGCTWEFSSKILMSHELEFRGGSQWENTFNWILDSRLRQNFQCCSLIIEIENLIWRMGYDFSSFTCHVQCSYCLQPAPFIFRIPLVDSQAMPRKTEIPSVRKTNRRKKPKSDPISSLDIIYGVLVYFAGSTIFYSMGMIIARLVVVQCHCPHV